MTKVTHNVNHTIQIFYYCTVNQTTIQNSKRYICNYMQFNNKIRHSHISRLRTNTRYLNKDNSCQCSLEDCRSKCAATPCNAKSLNRT